MSSRSTLADIHQLSWLALLAALIAAGALLQLSFGPVPFTLQDLFVVLAGLVLGPVRGATAVVLYLAAGVLGLPVFAGGSTGFAHLFGPTGGYLVGFVPMAWFSGLAAMAANPRQRQPEHYSASPSAFGPYPIQHPAYRMTLAAVLLAAGLLVQYIAGAAWLAYCLDFSAAKAISVGVAPFVLIDSFQVISAGVVWRLLLRQRLLPEAVPHRA